MGTRDGNANTGQSAGEHEAIASRFVQARKHGQSLPDFPGTIPPDLVSAYAIQDLAIAQWPDEVVGWKVGYIAADRRDISGDDRLLGPVFSRALWPATPELRFPVYVGGFGAVEAEYVLRLEADAPADKLDWSADEADAFPATLHTGVEIASSPLATINELGPRVVVSDFGNHNGLILGTEIPGWHAIPETELTCRTLIDGIEVGSGGATFLPGGLRAAFAFALARSARRGRPLKKGDLIASGNATGIHDIRVGQTAAIRFAGHGEITCTAIAAS
ncbi:2-keto-4-pentenoate hydratase [Pseudoxanthomonas helianthi]|uniref:2-keto-4-pentenoate hydratase n=1 Tax=Pseudoxanthomonas helianthi TaxID=1453541 RepID=A0A941B0K2_9GAMM|nr:2-keto-4-pentenoate hydratase [Pseudoxanthomonas helianthi]MBP3985743.1 2-keto-4-pentenoate hydratase [Pseudoxanthomonas helianthi]